MQQLLYVYLTINIICTHIAEIIQAVIELLDRNNLQSYYETLIIAYKIWFSKQVKIAVQRFDTLYILLSYSTPRCIDTKKGYKRVMVFYLEPVYYNSLTIHSVILLFQQPRVQAVEIGKHILYEHRHIAHTNHRIHILKTRDLTSRAHYTRIIYVYIYYGGDVFKCRNIPVRVCV